MQFKFFYIFLLVTSNCLFVFCESLDDIDAAQGNNQTVFKNRIYSEKDGYLWKSGYGTINMPPLTIDQYVWRDMASWENHTAVECGVTGRKYTFEKLRTHSLLTAVRLLREYALIKGDVVAISLPNIPEYPIAVLGIIEAGLIATTIYALATPFEISRQLQSSGAKLIVCSDTNVQAVLEATASLENIYRFVVKTSESSVIPNGTIDFMELMEIQGSDVDLKNFIENRDPSEICLLPYSSGTTGLPKGVMLTHTNIVSNCEMSRMPLPFQRISKPTTNTYQDVMPGALPLSHIFGMTTMLTYLATGIKIVTIPIFQADIFLDILINHNSTVLFIAPPIAQLLANSARATPEHFKSVKNVIIGGAPIGNIESERLHIKAPHINIIQGYGMTETSPVTFLGQLGDSVYASIGWPTASTEAKIANIGDNSFRGVDTNVHGELLVRSLSVMKGYWKNEQATKDVLLEDGWLRTGDIASYDRNGAFYIEDRLKELIKVKGFQVAPAELEAILKTYRCVIDAAVFGIPDERSGEVPRAHIVLESGCTVTDMELENFIAATESDYKKLSGGVEFVNAIPKTSSGKILRRELKATYLSKHA